MTVDRLVCANCAGIVAEGRCPVCRASRQRMQRSGGLNPAMLLAVALLVVAFVVVLARLSG